MDIHKLSIFKLAIGHAEVVNLTDTHKISRCPQPSVHQQGVYKPLSINLQRETT
ncbi:hypothetical protein FTV88_2773 [Heliorestis convoluta]|uniref:Uncharacterized protein n=1 Tax=Heliorestis convoluta TaxID=356322 RepID=A0A5Q2N679_9FIRM|nr:hypothetical protein FTV88_2773 [Heliorestis convoluta]